MFIAMIYGDDTVFMILGWIHRML